VSSPGRPAHARPVDPEAASSEGQPDETARRRPAAVVIQHSRALVESARVRACRKSEQVQVQVMAELVARSAKNGKDASQRRRARREHRNNHLNQTHLAILLCGLCALCAAAVRLIHMFESEPPERAEKERPVPAGARQRCIRTRTASTGRTRSPREAPDEVFAFTERRGA